MASMALAVVALVALVVMDLPHEQLHLNRSLGFAGIARCGLLAVL